MAKSMPSDFSNASPQGCWLQLPMKNAFLPTRTAGCVREYPNVLVPGMETTIVQFLLRHNNPDINWKRAQGRLGFGSTDSAIHYASPYQNGETVPVEVTPLQTHDFADSQA